jgi:hypothetical protein
MYHSYQFNPACQTKQDFGSGEQHGQHNTLWQRFKIWFMEPIDFPGKLPREEGDSLEYNSIGDESTLQSLDMNERQPPQS